MRWIIKLTKETQLEKITLEGKPNDKILHRPNPEKLVKGGVLHEDLRTAEQAYEEAMEDEYAKREGGAWSRKTLLCTNRTSRSIISVLRVLKFETSDVPFYIQIHDCQDHQKNARSTTQKHH